MLKPGSKAPDFQLPNEAGELVSLDPLLEKSDLILYFYPADFTPVCTAEACAFRDSYQDLFDAGIQIVGISPQSADSHQRFSSAHSLPFPLLCDEDKTVIKAYGVDGPLGFGVRRASFFIEQNKLIRNRVLSDLFVSKHMDLVRLVLDESEHVV